MQHITVTVPLATTNSPRSVVARQSLQTALNRAVPAKGQDEADFEQYGKYNSTKNRAMSPRLVRTAPGGGPGPATNEFAGRTRTGPNRQTAKTNIIDFGNVSLRPRDRLHVRGVDGFFPPVKMKSGSGSGKFVVQSQSTSARSSKSSLQDQDLVSSQVFNMELAPNHHDLGPDSVPHQSSTDWIQRRNNYQDGRATNNPSPHSNPATKQDPAPSLQTESCKKTRTPTPEGEGSGVGQRKRDAAWVRAFKVKQHRNSRYKEMVGSKSTSNLDDGHKWGLSDC